MKNELIKIKIQYGSILLLCAAILAGAVYLLFSTALYRSDLMTGFLCFTVSAAVMASVRAVYAAFARFRSFALPDFAVAADGERLRLAFEKKAFRIQLCFRLFTGALAIVIEFLVVLQLSSLGNHNMLLTAVILFLAMEHLMNTKKFGDRVKKICNMQEECFSLTELNTLLGDENPKKAAEAGQ